MRQVLVRALTFENIDECAQRANPIPGKAAFDEQPIAKSNKGKPGVRNENMLHFVANEISDSLVSAKLEDIPRQKEEQWHVKGANVFWAWTDQPDMAQYNKNNPDSFGGVNPFYAVACVDVGIHARSPSIELRSPLLSGGNQNQQECRATAKTQ